ILRRLIRRATRYARQLDINKSFMYELVPIVGEIMVDFYPEVTAQKDQIMKIIKNEEERFHETLSDGISRLETIMDEQRSKKRTVIPGETVYQHYDTFDFHKDLKEVNVKNIYFM